jgi:ABC-type multidrug transport system ATPase subunit
MKIRLQQITKQFGQHILFRNVDAEFIQGNSYALTGANGSGKSTLLQIMAGYVLPTEGVIEIERENKKIEPEQWYKHIAMATPYLELIEELTLSEMVELHHAMKPLLFSPKELITSIQLEHAAHKPVRYFSSGMKQKLKLALALFSDAPILLLDEPTANLDATNTTWYQQQILRFTSQKLIVIASNDSKEYDFCQQIIHVSNYKN